MGFAIAGGAALLGAAISSNASTSAASTEANAANNATQAEQNQYNNNVNLNAPWYASGKAALGTLNADMPSLTSNFSMADFQQDPGYQYRLQQGQQAIQQSQAARGGLLGGDTLKALTNYNQDQAANEYQQAYQNYNTNNTNTYNRLAGLAGVGQAAAASDVSSGTNTANQIGQNLTSAGNATAAGLVSSANSINSAIGSGTNNWMQYQMLNRLAPQNPPGTSSPY